MLFVDCSGLNVIAQESIWTPNTQDPAVQGGDFSCGRKSTLPHNHKEKKEQNTQGGREIEEMRMDADSQSR